MVRAICVLTFVHRYFLCEFVDGFGEGSDQLVRQTDTTISHPEISPRLASPQHYDSNIDLKPKRPFWSKSVSQGACPH